MNIKHRTGTTRAILATAVLATITALPGLTQVASSAPPPDTSTRSAPHAKPTIVLVHGAWAARSSWKKVATRMRKSGYTVKVEPNPLRNLSGDSAHLAAYLAKIAGPIVLVGHSYGGAVVTNAATGNRHVKALVYVDAFVPDQGESVVQLAAAKPGSALAVEDPTTVFRLVPYAGAPEGDANLYVLPLVFRTAFANDLTAKTAATLASQQRPVTFSALAEPSGPPAWKKIPSWYLIGTRDKVLPRTEQYAMAIRAHSTVVRVKAGHLSLISRPDAVAHLIVRAANATD